MSIRRFGKSTLLAGFLSLGVIGGVFGQLKREIKKTTLTSENGTSYLEPGYFMFPIQPGQENSLSGGLGDLRANQFHAGLDIRTGGREGLNVYAAADGYISRIAVFTGGYGNVIFIKHPNGLTTVYGHLKELKDTLGVYLREQQYRKQTFEIDLRPAPNQFPVKKGYIVALSGNTGGSGGPHLHFEVRDPKDNLINPLLYDFKELKDSQSPVIERIALKTLTTSSRINGEYQRVNLAPVRRSDGSYGINQPITASGLVGMEILGYDRTGGSPYKNGLNCIEIKLDGKEVFAYNMDTFPNELTRLMNIHENYEVEQLFGLRYHRCYVADGNTLPIYRTDGRRGRLPLFDGQPHEVEVTLFDVYQNPTVLRFTLQPEPATVVQATSVVPGSAAEAATITVDESVLKLAVRNFRTTDVPVALLFHGSKIDELPVSYIRQNQGIYLIDLNKHMPDSIQVGRGVVATNFRKRILPGRPQEYEGDGVKLNFDSKTLFDTLYLTTRQLPNGMLEINQPTIPVNDYLTVTWTPAYPVAVDTSRTRVYMVSGGRSRYVGGTWKNGRIEFRTRELGRFQLQTDVNPPSINILSASANGISARISDDRSGIGTFRALVNGEWVLMQYDYKRALIWSDKLYPDEEFPDDAEVIIEVTDRSGNVSTSRTIISKPKPKAKVKAKSTAKKKAAPKGKSKKRRR